jgi:trehalose 6-phosphate synthase
MNLVAKEFVTAQGAVGGSGALVLSEFAGAIEELTEALPCNPFDVEGLAGTIDLSLQLTDDDRRFRIERMCETVRGHDVGAWIAKELQTLQRRTARA